MAKKAKTTDTTEYHAAFVDGAPRGFALDALCAADQVELYKHLLKVMADGDVLSPAAFSELPDGSRSTYLDKLLTSWDARNEYCVRAVASPVRSSSQSVNQVRCDKYAAAIEEVLCAMHEQGYDVAIIRQEEATLLVGRFDLTRTPRETSKPVTITEADATLFASVEHRLMHLAPVIDASPAILSKFMASVKPESFKAALEGLETYEKLVAQGITSSRSKDMLPTVRKLITLLRENINKALH